VDDEESLVKLGHQMLETLGYKVTSLTSSREALDRFKINPGKYDLVITDYTMPQMTGFDLTREILSVKPDVPVILCTGFSEQVSDEQASTIGVKRVIMKPLPIREVAETIREVLDMNETPTTTDNNGQTEIRKILLAEDDAVNQKLIVTMLERKGHLVVVVDDGQKAVEAFESGDYDLILMDIQMPKMDGLEATRIIREKSTSYDKHIPIIALTGYSQVHNMEKFSEAGIDDYIQKPIRLNTLFSIIEKY
jgi:CheY-like chemotaxis protein